MGLFGSLFKKKICDCCGAEIGLLGNRKLENGNCCKSCAGKLSPWFSERKNSTVAEIKEQLLYREENRSAVDNFCATRVIGSGYKVYLDENTGKFFVSCTSDYRQENPDVMDVACVAACNLDIEEFSDELFCEVESEGEDGEVEIEEESYSPKRYCYSYSFFINICVNHPFFKTISFRLDDVPVEINISDDDFFYPPLPGRATPPSMEERAENPEYARYVAMGEDIIRALTMRREVREESAAADVSGAVSASSTECPWCGSETAAVSNGFCECCGGKLDA